MAILIDGCSRVIIQGITGTVGRDLASLMLEGRTTIVGGVTPGKGGQTVEGLPVFDSCAEAVSATGADCSFLCVPAPYAKDACLEALDAGIKVITTYTENVPISDAIAISSHAAAKGAVVLGPNAAGCVSPGLASLSDMNEGALQQGSVGIVSKSGAVTYDIAELLRQVGLGMSTIACLGGDPVIATGYREILERFEADSATEVVILVGEIGGQSEMKAAERIATMRTPVVALVLGRHAPPGKAMGHAGALLGAAGESAVAKIDALRSAGAVVAETIADIGCIVRETLMTRPRRTGSS